MTDKIIAHGIDVSDCFYRCENMECLVHTNLDGMPTCNCDSNSVKNCYYKRLKRKEQECEKLRRDYLKQNEWLQEQKRELSSLLAEKNAMEIGRDEYKQECEELKETIRAYQEDRFCQGGCAIYQYDKIHKLIQALEEKEQEIERYKKEVNRLNKIGYCYAYEKGCHEICKQQNCIIKNGYKYKQALDDICLIVNKFKEQFDFMGSDLEELNEILDIINKAKEELNVT